MVAARHLLLLCRGAGTGESYGQRVGESNGQRGTERRRVWVGGCGLVPSVYQPGRIRVVQMRVERQQVLLEAHSWCCWVSRKLHGSCLSLISSLISNQVSRLFC